jgi:hypothetical protein
MIRSFTFILFSAFLLHCGQSRAQYVVLEEEEQKALAKARAQAIEEAKAARPYDGYVEPTTQRQVYSEDYNPEQHSQEWAEQEQLLAEERARLEAEAAAQAEAEAALTEEATNTEASATDDSREQTAEENNAEEDQEISSENSIKPLYDEGTPVRKTIAQRRAERRAAKKDRVFR